MILASKAGLGYSQVADASQCQHMRSILAVKTSWLVAFMHEAAVTALQLAPKHSKTQGWNLYPAGIPIGLRDDPLMRAGLDPPK